jgi:hypothetical protein
MSTISTRRFYTSWDSHTKHTCRHAGRDYRLTDVHGEVVKSILS